MCELDAHIEFYTRAVHERANEARLQTVPGFGPVVATPSWAIAAGASPKQHSSGGKTVLLGISKRGDRYLRAWSAWSSTAAQPRTG